MSDEDALLTAIDANPEEDTPRLAYADWLDENADALRDPALARRRAEFIRVQCGVAVEEGAERRCDPWGPLRTALLGPLTAIRGRANILFRGGFVWLVELPVEQFLQHAELLAAVRPLPNVRVTDVASAFPDFLRCRELNTVTALSTTTNPGDRPTVPDVWTVRSAAARLTRLAVLNLERSGLADWSCELLRNFSPPALQVLNLTRSGITDAGVDGLLRTSHPTKLRQLLLSGNPITDAGAIALVVEWPRGEDDQLEVLELRNTHIGPDGAGALVERFGGRVAL